MAQELRRAIDGMDSFGTIDRDLANGLASLLRLMPDRKLAEDLIGKVSATPMWREKADASSAQAWVDGQVRLAERIDEHGLGDIYESSIVVPNGPEGYVVGMLGFFETEPRA